jgi:putative protease
MIKKLFKLFKKKEKKPKNKTAKISSEKSKPAAMRKTAKKQSIKISSKKPIKKDKLLAVAVHYFSKIKVVVLKMKGNLSLNDKIRIKGFTTNLKQTVTSMQIDHEPIREAKKGQEIGIKVTGKVRHGDKVFKI